MSLALKLADLRRKSGESLQQVADAVGVAKTHVWQLERGSAENPSLALLKSLAAHFGVTVAWLAGEGEDPKQADVELAKLFRLARGLNESERKILADMARSLKENRQGAGR